jgi:hypothetical protein
MDDETFATESEPWVTVHNNRRRRNIAIAGILIVVASVAALVLGVTLYDRGGISGDATRDSGFGSGETVFSPTAAPTRTPPTLAPTQAPTKLSLLGLLQRESLGDGSELLDASTYQYQAMAWLETIDHESLSDDAILQKFALACIFYATYEKRTLYTDAVYGYDAAPPGWNRTDNWLSQESECTWFGILCNNNGKVNDIELYSNSLTGSFPPEVVYLNQSLKALDLYDNVIWNQGDPGHAWLEQMTNLQYLFYGNTFFQYDGIPTYIGALTNLIKYDCSTTLYFGDLRGEIFQNLQNLTYLVMGDNSYNMATVPSQIINLPKLQYLYMHNCDLQGNLAFMKHFTQMQEFRIDKNLGIKGSIPSQIGQLSDSLVTFSATDCSLSGSIPSEIGLLTNMRKIWLSGNSITGRVPTEIGRLKKLEVLEVYDNGLQGIMPSPVCNLVVPSTNGGNLTTLVADCEVLNCTCCTSCK